jgi:uncharacterized phage protein gp47/JayE
VSGPGCDCLDACGCCEAPGDLTPQPLENPLGLSQLAYRVGTHGSFKETMLRQLPAAEPPGHPLSALTTREDDDPTIGLIDAWAGVLDVLTFYQERIVNEGFLRTATERRSIRELASAIGYKLAPGAAACAYLAFELETAEGAPAQVEIGTGVKVQSIPGPGELPQTFETIDGIEARPEWNAIEPQVTKTQLLSRTTTQLVLEGTANVKRGDMLLLVGHERRVDPGSERWDLRRIETVRVDASGTFTTVGWTEPLGALVAGHEVLPAQQDVKAYVLRTRAALFGGSAPDARALPDEVVTNLGGTVGSDWSLSLAGIRGSSGSTIFLDAVYSEIVTESWVILADGINVELYEVLEAVEDARSGFTLNSKTSRLELSGEGPDALFNNRVRQTTVWGGADELPIARARVEGPVGGPSQLSIPLERPIPTLPGDRPLIVTGKVAGSAGDELTSELAWTAKPDDTEPTQTVLHLRASAPLANSYERGTVTIAANVANASHGESRSEILGSGDAAVPFQRFTLKGSPLTYVPSEDSPTGAVSTLTVRVNELEWHEHRDLYGLGGRERAYVASIDDERKAAVEFGDGETGARLPSGVENVKAGYRIGTGLAGLVKPGQLTLLSNPPLGVKRVTNPFAATGASDPEAGDAARDRAPLTVRTLDRTVSLDDFEDFAASFAGIGKAQASWLWSGEQRVIVLTLAAADGSPLDPSSVAFSDLAKALVAAGEPRRPIRLVPCVPRPFEVAARLVLDPDFLSRRVLEQAAAALRDSLVFKRRAFAQPVAQSEVEATLQAVPGVVAVDLTQLHFVGDSGVRQLLLASGATFAGGVATGAELLQLAPDGIAVTQVKTT